ncbi:MAG: hypothetical protein IPP71_08840 [Bacteroidetes bacterium]|nr:hypothetical protein [Bacteroidota bacterium]
MMLTSFRILKVLPGICFLLVFLLFSFSTSAQSKKIEIQIVDNAGIYNNRLEYHISNDSLIVAGLGDYGRTPVNYLRRSLTSKERKTIGRFMKTFPIDSLDDLYNNEFNPAQFDNKGYYARIMEITVSYDKRTHFFRTRNCWVRYSDDLIQLINPLLSPEVRIRYEKAQFNVFY